VRRNAIALVAAGLATSLMTRRDGVAQDLRSSTAPTQEPALFSPGVISTGDHETHLELSPDGKTAYFLKNAPDFAFWAIYVSYQRNGRWSRPEIAPFSGRFVDADPHVTSDGHELFFISNRPADPAADAPSRDFDIWVMARLPNGEWAAPRRLGAPVNTPASEYYPRTAADGTLYFGSDRAGGHGGADIWRCRFANGKYQPAENLGDAVNSAAQEYEPFITPDQKTLIFMAAGRDGRREEDLFISFAHDGGWSHARALDPPINSPTAREYAPKISPDGKWFLFSSTRGSWDRPNKTRMTTQEYEKRLRSPGNGLGDIYYIDAKRLPKPEP
jgi:Tol biopolymer transport system component